MCVSIKGVSAKQEESREKKMSFSRFGFGIARVFNVVSFVSISARRTVKRSFRARLDKLALSAAN